MKKKYIIVCALALAFLSLVIFLSPENNKRSSEITDLRTTHKEHLNNSPFNSTLQLTKKERKAEGIPPNKYFEEQWELTMNPELGRPTAENLKQIQQTLIERRSLSSLARTVPGENTENVWIERGPNNVAGRTRAIMFDPNDATDEIVFAGGVSGGLWKNTNISNADSQWTRVGILENLAVSSITYDPNNTSVFYLGTGESYVGGDVNGDGLWKSEDAGNTWIKVFGGVSGDSFFESANNLTVNSPVSIAGDLLYRPTTSFGTTITSVITADLALADDGTASPTEACNVLTNDLNGKIALIRRGSCDFDAKAKNAENAGAIAVIVMNNIEGDPISMGGDDTTIMIPAVMITKADGDLLEATLATDVVNLSLNPRSGDFTGLLVPGIQHINDVVVRNNAGVSEIYVAAGDSFYSDANAATFLSGPEFGLYKSIDGGINWTEIILPLTTNGNKSSPNDIEIGPDNKIWVATINSIIFGDGGGTVLSSTDGATFSKAYEIPGGNRTQIAVSETDAQKIYIIAEGSTTAVPLILERTDDGFATTVSLALPNDADTGIPANDFTRGQAFYDLMISVDPINDDIAYTGGIDLFKTVDGGTAWSQLSKWSENNNLAALNVPLVHADHHNMVYGNTDNKKVLFVTDGGVFYSKDAGITIDARNTGFNVTQFYSVAVGPLAVYGADFFLAGAQDNGSQIFQNVDSNDGPHDTFEVLGGDGGYCFFDQDGSEAYFIVNIFFNDGIYLFNFDADGGNGEWVELNRETTSNGSFINPEELDSNLDILYSNYSSGGNSIIKKYSGIKSSSTLTKADLTDAIFISTPTALKISPYTATSSKLYVGTRLGDLFKVEHAEGDNPVWSEITGASFVGSISDVELGANEDEIFVTMHNYGVENIWYTNDGGLSWLAKEGDLPDLPVKTILQNPLNYEEVIVGTDLGVWFTNNFSSATPTWNQAYNGMSNVKVTDLDLREDNMVFASTYGRGVFSGAFKLAPDGDIDGDGVLNGVDICPQVANADQADSDGNGIGDVCQDTDNDTILDINDNCPTSSNIDQSDSDGNGVGDTCQDTDADGVFDVDDNCIDISNPDQEDTNGNGNGDACDTSYESPENITLEVISETCEGSNNGTIIINTIQTYVTYTATLVGNGLDLTQAFNASTSHTFEDIAVGSYTVCVIVDGRTYEQCFEINIDAAEPLDAVFESRFNNDSEFTSITINQGTPPFNITFNGEVVRITSERSFEIETLESGVLEITTSKACEGIATKMVTSGGIVKAVASPNPVINTLKVTLPNVERELIPVQVYSVSGQLLFNKTIYKGSYNFIEVPFETLNKGIYFVKVNVDKPIVFKIFK